MNNILKLYFSSKGRINRSTYAVTYFSAMIVFTVLYRIFLESPFIANIVIMPLLTILFFNLSVQRFHDVDRSGWYTLLFFAPFVNFVAFLYLLFKKGTTGSNRFGPSPSSSKAKNNDDIVFDQVS